jgi:high-affinity K+ transport system ATPase subunit B
MATKADLDTAVGAMKEYTLRTLLIALTPLYLGMIAMAIGIAGLYFTG